MGLPRIVHLLFWLTLSMPPMLPATSFFVTVQDDIPAAIVRYKALRGEEHEHDMEALQRIGLLLLQQGMRSGDPETMLLSIFGSGVALHEQAMQLLEEAICSSRPEHQLAALTLLAGQLDTRTERACLKALGSPFLAVRLEAAHLLAQMRHPEATAHIEALMMKVEPRLYPLFSQLLAVQADAAAVSKLRQLLHSSDIATRTAAILSAANTENDQLLDDIQTLVNQLHPSQQEACAYTLGILDDGASIPRLWQLTESSPNPTRLAALRALHRLGEERALPELMELASSGDVLAIASLGQVAGSNQVLYDLLRSNNRQICLNAAVALAERGDARCVPFLVELLTSSRRDQALLSIHSPGGTCSAWDLVPSATQNLKNQPMIYELSIRMKEQLLGLASKTLPPSALLELLEQLLRIGEGCLIPSVIGILQELHTDQAVALLQTYQHKLGDPLVRHYCELGLVRSRLEGPHRERLRRWLTNETTNEMIQFRPILPWEMHQSEPCCELTPTERARLLFESYETFSAKRDPDGIDLLLDAICNGHPRNRYALAGLLVRATH